MNKLQMINKLRSDYEFFDEFLEDKDSISNDDLIGAFFNEIKNFKGEHPIDFKLNSEFVNQDASDILFLIRNIINKPKQDKTKIFIGALIHIAGSLNWNDLNYSVFEELIGKMDPELFIENPYDTYLSTIRNFDGLLVEDSRKFIKYIIVKIIFILCQKRTSPLAYNILIQEGIFKKGIKIEIISKRVFLRYRKSIISDDKDLKLLIEIIEKYVENVDEFWKYVSIYKIDNYKSKYILKLKRDDDLAILIPKYEKIDYSLLNHKINQMLISKNYEKVTKIVSLEKVVLFFHLVIEFNKNSKDDHYYISSQKFSSFIGEPKIVNLICDVLEDEGIFIDKKSAIPEIRSKSYKLSFDVEIESKYALSDPLIISKLNSNIELKYGILSDKKLLFFEEIIKIIEFRSIDEKVNLTKIFLDSMSTFPLKILLIIIVSLKFRIKKKEWKGDYTNYINAFESIDEKSAKTLYYCFYKRFYLFLKNFDEANYYNFSIPSLPELVSKESALIAIENKFSLDYIKNNAEEIKHEIVKYVKNGNDKIYKMYIDELEEFCRFNN